MSFVKGVLIVVFLAIALGACGSPNSSFTRTPDISPKATASPESGTTPTLELSRRGTVVPVPINSTMAIGTPDGILTAMIASDISHRDVHQVVSETLTTRGPGIAYSRLLRLETGGDITQPSLLLECDLCMTWEMLDPITYRFQLRSDVSWQDIPPLNGRRLTAEDMVFSYQRQNTSGWPNASLLSALDTVEMESEFTLKFNLRYPDVDFLMALADGHSKVVAKEVVDGPLSIKDGPVVGTGPWIWRQTIKGIGSDFEANHNYFEEALPLLQEISFKVIKDPETQLAAFLTEVVDVYDVSGQRWTDIQNFNKGYRTFLSKQGGRGVVLTMNVSGPPFNNVDVRRAVFKALDPWTYLDEIWSGLGFVSQGVPVVEHTWLLDRKELTRFFRDPTSAEDTRVDVSVGFDLTVADFGDAYLEQGLAIKRDLQRAGFRPNLQVLNPAEYSERVWGERAYKLFVGPLPPTSSPNSYLFSVLHSEGQWNILAHDDSELNDLIESQQATSFTHAQRQVGIQLIQRYLFEQAYMFSPVTHSTMWLLQDRVQGFYPNTALSEYFYWAEAWVKV